MNRLTQQQIDKINSECQYDLYGHTEGIYKEPYGVPIHIKDYVIICRYEVGGVSGGSCWDSSNPQPYTKDEPENKMQVLDLVLKELLPNITYLQFKGIEKLKHNNSETEWEYYGNSTEWEIEYIVLEELYNYLETLNQ
jgi:hypothetical protein